MKDHSLKLDAFKIEELEERLEMGKWTLSVSSTQTIKPTGTEFSNTQKMEYTFGK